jgi:uncharacterized repeat protein (TIGR01451 family)
VSIPAATDINRTPAIQNLGSVQYTFTLPDGRNVRQIARSNTVTTLLFSPVITVQIQGEPPVVEPGGLAEFRIEVTNSGNYQAEVSVIRLVPQGSIINPNTVTIDNGGGTSQIRYNGSVPLGLLQPGQTVILTYLVQISNGYMGRSLNGFCSALYLFTIDGRRYSGEARSNDYKLLIEQISE